ncbi:type II toxin-antitoxin system PemK/MazF family toxin [Nitrospirillum amazonense]|uniref:type II toxin-antitoxin system PemK/MazF family toxin n=1 Tax=Nitrospirillum amazonense TaxID=28077 RepID=UPI002DD41B83|nr:type II toxin-antitoxin system PemK/MazF family toxin [Nitrospirillum amazonense]MEC4589860.1 type II toxin-antitoxin system PemK/MazF family toxin [Nitrospirillum amazonense]
MRRGDVVTVAANGDYGKPRPALVIQTDALPHGTESLVLVQFTTGLVEADFRVMIEPSAENGLRAPSQVMADKPVTVRRDRVGAIIGRLSADQMAKVTAALAFVIGLSD